MKQLCIGSIGGTIAMIKDSSGGISPKLDANDLLEALPTIKSLANIKTQTLFFIASGHITFSHLLEVYHWAKDAVHNGADGIVITQGTDTLEESAFFLSLLWQESVPLVLTGAMKAPKDLGSDGLSNLYTACLSALHSKAKGVMVVINHTIHHPLWIQKTHSLALETFSSFHQEIGNVFEENVEFFNIPKTLPTFNAPSCFEKKVFAYTHVLDDEKEILQWASEHYDGIVLSGYGAGHSNPKALEIIAQIANKIPVIMCARTHNGPSAMKTYGYAGSEIDLQNKGVVMSGWLQPKKARILLSVLLNCNLGLEDFIHYRDCIPSA